MTPVDPSPALQTAASARRSQIVGGVASILAGALSGGLAFRHPERMHAPAWVVYAACAAFVLFGLSLLAQAWQFKRLPTVISLFGMVAFVAPFGWVAFGGGARACTASVGWFSQATNETLCRVAFGSGFLLGTLLLIAVTWRTLRRRP